MLPEFRAQYPNKETPNWYILCILPYFPYSNLPLFELCKYNVRSVYAFNIHRILNFIPFKLNGYFKIRSKSFCFN